MPHASHPRIKAFVDAGCQSWLIACPETGDALLVDPKVGRGPTYDKALADFGWRVVAVVDTHTHADHLSDSNAASPRDADPPGTGSGARPRN